MGSMTQQNNTQFNFSVKPQLEDPDSFYAALLEAHTGLSSEQSAALNARLILILANQIGHQTVLAHCIKAACIETL
jgi:hypothetical protein